MRSVVLIIILILASSSLCAQSDSIQSNPAYASKAVYFKDSKEWKSYKKLNIAGWSALAVGVPTTLYGLIGTQFDKLNEGATGGVFIAVVAVGGALTLSSVPILIIANRYKNKAKTSHLNVGFTNLKTVSYIGNNEYAPAIRLTLDF